MSHEAARQAKAESLARTCRQLDLDADAATGFSDFEWRLLARLAGVKLPSVETRRLVLGMLRQPSAGG